MLKAENSPKTAIKSLLYKESIFPYLLIAPGSVALLLFIAYPMITNIFMSFFDYKLVQIIKPFVFLDNYIQVLSSGRIWESLVRTITWTGFNILFMNILGLIVAIFLATGFRGNTVIKATILIPWVLPQVVTGYTWSLMLSQDIGVVNHMLQSLGIVPPNFSWFQSGGLAMTAVIIANVWRGFPFFALMIYAKLSTLPRDQVEAARIDGANIKDVFIHITVPYIQSTIKTCSLLAFIWTFNAYDILKVMTNGGPAEETLTLSLIVQREAFQYYELSRAATMSVVMFFAMFAILALLKGIMDLSARRNDR